MTDSSTVQQDAAADSPLRGVHPHSFLELLGAEYLYVLGDSTLVFGDSMLGDEPVEWRVGLVE